MQVFLPSISVRRSFNTLDTRRLNKQHLELHQLLGLVDRKQRGERSSHHAAVNLFIDHSLFLEYCFAVCADVCIERGINIRAYYNDYLKYKVAFNLNGSTPRLPKTPPWFGRKEFHSAHRQALLAKSLARKLKAEQDLMRLAEYSNTPVSNKDYYNAITEWQWYRSFGWDENPNTTVYNYYWWNPNERNLYIGPDRNALIV